MIAADREHHDQALYERACFRPTERQVGFQRRLEA
jgi:hypothetical protein